jgi:hypothetical protein
MKVFFDTEFSTLDGFLTPIKLVSAGFVAENGEEFYAEFKNNFEFGECSSFVHEAVLPHLNFEKHGMQNSEFRLKFKGWIQSFKEPVELYSDSISYDFELLLDLYDDEHKHNWPTNLASKAVSVNSRESQQGIEIYFECQPMAIRHHALWDARALAASVKAYECGIRYDKKLGSNNDI